MDSSGGLPPNHPGDVPPSKHPKSRPPTDFRDKIIHTPLPQYSGPYTVGFMDIEVPAKEPRNFSDITRHHKPLLKLDTVLFSIYYPSGFGSGQGSSPEGEKKWSRATWLPRPRIKIAKGYGKFAGCPEWPMAAFFACTTMFKKLPAFRNAKLADHWPAEQNSREAGYEVKNEAGDPPSGEPEKPVFPLLIFSHGLGGTRTTYSTVCGEFASYGFVVCALEHRDGSGPRTYVNLPQERSESGRASKQFRRRYRKVDYVFPKGNAADTTPGNEQGVDVKLRSAQIQLRMAEIGEAFEVLCLINEGRGAEVADLNFRRTGNIASSSRGLKGVDWNSWKGRFHQEQVTILGHSFGGATAVEVLRHHDRFHYIGQGIIYDIWGGAVRDPQDMQRKIKVPLLGINSEAFMYWPHNLDTVLGLCQEVKEQGALCWLMTVRGSIHISQSDFSLLYPRLSSLLLKMTVNPQRAIDLNINASLEFLKIVMPQRISAMNRGTNEHLLEVSTLDKLPEEHKPRDKWTALRLYIPNEMKLRLTAPIFRMYKRHKKQEAEERLPKDPNGKVLEGLEELVPGEEIWMHVAPTKQELDRHGVRLERELDSGDEGMVDGSVQDPDSVRKNSRGLEQMAYNETNPE